jgi:hypothetical protein
VNINLDLREPKLTFGVVGASPTQQWWKSFVSRFGKIKWTIERESENKEKVKDLLRSAPVEVVLLEAGRVGENSEIWKGEACKVVISLEGWRGCPPREWRIQRKRIRHESLGGGDQWGIHGARGPSRRV